MRGVIVPPSNLIVTITFSPKGGFLIRGGFLLRGGDYSIMLEYIIYVTMIVLYVLYDHHY